jgi:protein SDA1
LEKFPVLPFAVNPPTNLLRPTTMKRKVGALEKLESDHAALRFKLKRDPQSYRDDFEQQYQQYRTLLDLFLADPSTTDGGLVALKE